MNSNDYAKTVLMTEAVPKSLNIANGNLASIMALAASVGLLIDLSKKAIFYGNEPDNEQLHHSLVQCIAASSIAFESFQEGEEGDRIEAAAESKNFDRNRINIRLLHSAFGKLGEAAELFEALFEQATGKPLDTLNFLEELGDSDWYGPIAYDELGVTEEVVRAMNMAKLTMVRYAAKSFSGADAKTRKKELERKAMNAVLQFYRADPEGFTAERALNAVSLLIGVDSPLKGDEVKRAQQIISDAANEDIAIDFQNPGRTYNPKG